MLRKARLTLFAVLATLPAPPAHAQLEATRVTGTVVDADGRPLEGATVEILGTDRRAVTGASGTYRLDVPPGRYWILTRRVGYAPVRVAVTLGAARPRSLPFELESLPVHISELAVLAQSGMSRDFHQDFVARSRGAFGEFLTRDDLAGLRAPDVVAAVQRHLPGRSRYALEQRFESAGAGRLFRRYAIGSDGSLIAATSILREFDPNCPPALSVNGGRPWPGLSLADFTLDDLEALEIYRRGSWVPTEFTFRDGGGCGLVVLWLR